MFSKPNLLLFSATFLANTASAQDFIKNNTVGSCVDVDCPTRPNSTMADCRIQNQTHSFIGLRTFDTAITPYQENVTWTVGMTKYDSYDEQGRNESTLTVEKDFYFGTPPSLNLTNASLPYQGCAILFSGNVAMGLPANYRNSGGPCEDIIGNSCIPSLVTQTKTLIAVNGSRYNNQSDGQACERLKEDFRLSFPRACIGLTAEESWKDISALPLTGPSAIAPPSESANASSNCHPTLPKSNTLSKAFAYNQTMVYGRGSEVQIINNIDLVLTVFWSPDGEVEDALEEPDAHAVCLYPINLDEETPDANEGMAARSVRWSSNAAVGAAAIFFAVMFM